MEMCILECWKIPFPNHNDRGWMLHYNSNLSKTKIPGSFGWDDTASIVPATAVPGYTGSSQYLIMTKYNNYAGVGTGDGHNKIAILDPNATENDPDHSEHQGDERGYDAFRRDSRSGISPRSWSCSGMVHQYGRDRPILKIGDGE